MPFLIFVLSGPFDFAQGRLLKRCSSTVSLSFDGGTEQNQDQSQRQRTRASALHWDSSCGTSELVPFPIFVLYAAFLRCAEAPLFHGFVVVRWW